LTAAVAASPGGRSRGSRTSVAGTVVGARGPRSQRSRSSSARSDVRTFVDGRRSATTTIRVGDAADGRGGGVRRLPGDGKIAGRATTERGHFKTEAWRATRPGDQGGRVTKPRRRPPGRRSFRRREQPAVDAGAPRAPRDADKPEGASTGAPRINRRLHAEAHPDRALLAGCQWATGVSAANRVRPAAVTIVDPRRAASRPPRSCPSR